MLLYIIIFVFIMVLAIDYEFNKRRNIYTLFFVALVLALMAGLRSPDIEKDYGQYLLSFDLIYNDPNPLYLAIFEPGFLLIVFTVRSIVHNNFGMVIMLIYAFGSVFLKLFSIRSLAINPYLVILFYFSHFFFMHEMTQIRVGLATAIFFVALVYLFKGNKRAFIGLIVLATLFHYTAILYFGILFFNKDSINKYFYTGIIAVSVLLSFINIPLIGYLANLDSNVFTVKIANYTVKAENVVEKVNVLNVVTICNIFCCLYLMYAALPIEFMRDKKLTIILKCNIFSIFFLSFLSGIPAIAFRVSDLFGILSMFSFAYLTRYLPFGKYNIFICLLLAGTFFYFFALSGTLVKPYKMVDL